MVGTKMGTACSLSGSFPACCQCSESPCLLRRYALECHLCWSREMSPSNICVLPQEKSRKGISVHHVSAWRSPVGLARRTNQRLIMCGGAGFREWSRPARGRGSRNTKMSNPTKAVSVILNKDRECSLPDGSPTKIRDCWIAKSWRKRSRVRRGQGAWGPHGIGPQMSSCPRC
jgi:hypothetical protein